MHEQILKTLTSSGPHENGTTQYVALSMPHLHTRSDCSKHPRCDVKSSRMPHDGPVLRLVRCRLVLLGQGDARVLERAPQYRLSILVDLSAGMEERRLRLTLTLKHLEPSSPPYLEHLSVGRIHLWRLLAGGLESLISLECQLRRAARAAGAADGPVGVCRVLCNQ